MMLPGREERINGCVELPHSDDADLSISAKPPFQGVGQKPGLRERDDLP